MSKAEQLLQLCESVDSNKSKNESGVDIDFELSQLLMKQVVVIKSSEPSVGIAGKLSYKPDRPSSYTFAQDGTYTVGRGQFSEFSFRERQVTKVKGNTIFVKG